MIARFVLFTLAWMTAAFAAPERWRVLVLALVGIGGAAALRRLWVDDVPSLARGRDWLLGAGAGVVMALATGPAYRISASLVPELRPEVVRLYDELALEGRPWVLVPFLAVVALEELVWRGAAFRLGIGANAWATAAIATLLYALAQGGLLSPVVVLVALACGFVWSALRVLTGGLAAAVACHAVWDLAVFVVFPLE